MHTKKGNDLPRSRRYTTTALAGIQRLRLIRQDYSNTIGVDVMSRAQVERNSENENKVAETMRIAKARKPFSTSASPSSLRQSPFGERSPDLSLAISRASSFMHSCTTGWLANFNRSPVLGNRKSSSRTAIRSWVSGCITPSSRANSLCSL